MAGNRFILTVELDGVQKKIPWFTGMKSAKNGDY